ncbi:glycosyltransferase family 4 protein [Sphingomonas sp. CV7422]|uniref:glycosyltransferase family 4 protein n=1 Tax=Sphingomonas sp. CV7422 TaxID=3018036 RepID=UPI0022FF2291|nr:glycosyltransferase family 4 protein [Sphingomonas sp. CV7422]
MKIVHYLNHTEKANGHVAVSVDLACAQVEAGHDVYMVSGPGDFDAILRRHGVTVVTVPHSKGPLPLRLLRMAAAFLPVIRRIRPDVVNAHMVAAAITARVIQPLIGYKLITTVHNSFDRQSPMMRVGDRVIAVSDAVRTEMIGKGIKAEKLRTIRNGTIGGARRPSMPEQLMDLQHPAITTVGGLHPRKGINRLIEAFAVAHRTHPNAHLYIVGDGPRRRDYEKQALASGSGSSIHFLGHLDDPREVLGSTDIFALASLSEPFGLVVAEARQMGCAIVATNVDGIPEAVGEPSNAILVPPNDAEALAKGLDRLLSDTILREKMAMAAGTALDELTVRRMSDLTLDLYTEAIGG